MSSRQLRKLQQQRELEAQAELLKREEEEEDEEEPEPVTPIKTKASLFANLVDLEDAEQDDDDEEEEDVGTGAQQLSDPAPAPTIKKAKKSKKKKKPKNAPKVKDEKKETNSDDEIDNALKELSVGKTTGNTTNSPLPKLDPEYERVCKLLGIQALHLKVANEMRNLFGREVLDNHDDAGGRARGSRRQQRPRQVDLETILKGRHAPGKGLSEVTLRRNPFIQGKDDWPRASTGGLTMEMVEENPADGTVEFKFVHNKIYQDLQRAFRGYVEIGDPQNLIGLLTANRKSSNIC